MTGYEPDVELQIGEQTFEPTAFECRAIALYLGTGQAQVEIEAPDDQLRPGFVDGVSSALLDAGQPELATDGGVRQRKSDRAGVDLLAKIGSIADDGDAVGLRFPHPEQPEASDSVRCRAIGVGDDFAVLRDTGKYDPEEGLICAYKVQLAGDELELYHHTARYDSTYLGNVLGVTRA